MSEHNQQYNLILNIRGGNEMNVNRKKKWKTILIAAVMTGLTAVSPVYGADFMMPGANRIIRVGEDGKTTSYTPNSNSSSDTEQTPLEPGFSQIENQDSLSDSKLNDQQTAEQTQQQEASQVQDTNTPVSDESQTEQTQQQEDSQVQDTNTPVPDESQTEQTQQQEASQVQDTNTPVPDESQTEQPQQQEDSQIQQPAEQPAASEEPQVSQLPAGIRALDPTKPMLALTYDDGPYAPVGNRIMDVMNQYGGKCTFFMVGNRITSYADEVRRMANEGFEVANHTQDHKNLSKTNAEQIQAQVAACNNIIQAVSGIRPTLMRLPGGNKNSTVLANTGMPMIMWNIDTLDWKTRNAQSTINSVLGKVKDGDIILMHELYSATAAATEALVPALTAQGFQLVTVSELAYYKGTSLNAGQLYYSIR